MASLVTDKKITRNQLKTIITSKMTEIRNTAIRLHRNKLPESVRGKLSDKMDRAGKGFFDMDKLNNALDELGYNDERTDEEKEHEKQQLESIAQMIETLEYDWFKYNDDNNWPENTKAEDRIDDPDNWSGAVGNWQDQIKAINDHYQMDTYGRNGKVHFVVQGVLNGDFKTNQELLAEQKACELREKEEQKKYCEELKKKQEAKRKAHQKYLKEMEAKDRKEAQKRGMDVNKPDWRKTLNTIKREEAKAKAKESSSDYYSSSEDEEELRLKWLEIPPGELQNIFGKKILVDAEGDPDNIYNEEGTITGYITEKMVDKGWIKTGSRSNPGTFYFKKSGHKSLWATKGGKGVFPIIKLIDGMKKPAAQEGGKRKTRKRKRKRRRKRTKKKRKRKRTKKKRKRKRRKTRK